MQRQKLRRPGSLAGAVLTLGASNKGKEVRRGQRSHISKGLQGSNFVDQYSVFTLTSLTAYDDAKVKHAAQCLF